MRAVVLGLCCAWACAAALVSAADAGTAVDAAVDAAQPLPKFNVNIKDTSVTGLSSGAFFAVQMHVTFSSFIRAAAVFAGGPYHCAQGSLVTAEMQCMYAMPAPDPSQAVATTNSRAQSGAIDAVANLANSFVYLYSGTGDQTVHPPVMTALYNYYLSFVPATHVTFDNTTASAHTQPTDDPVNTEACGVSQSPYISDCQYDGAGIGMTAMAGGGPLQPRNNGTLSGSVISFDQTEFCPNQNCAAISLADTGYAFVPVTCAAGSACSLLLAFHGCEQNYAAVGLDYVNHSGYNKWADTNGVIVLYPQTVSSEFNPSNPNGCWDWWGFSDANYDTNTGVQPTTVRAMVKRITGQ